MNFILNNPTGIFPLNVRTRNKSVYSINLTLGYNKRGITGLCIGKEPYKTLPFIERIDHFTHNHYVVCFCMMIEEISNCKISKKLSHIRTVILELERIYCHLFQIGRMLLRSDFSYMQNLIGQYLELILDMFEEISGSRIYHSSHKIAGLSYNFSQGNKELVRQVVNKFSVLTGIMDRTLLSNPSLMSINKGLAIIDEKDVFRHSLSGPLSWGINPENDLRLAAPYLSYGNIKIKKILKDRRSFEQNCSYSRIMSLMEDIKSSIKIIESLIAEDLIYDSDTNISELKFNSGIYKKEIESPRGMLTCSVELSNVNTIKNLWINSPSDNNYKVLNSALMGTLVDNIPIAVESLYISIKEIDK